MASYTDSVIGMRVWQALQVVQTGNVWVGIGKSTPWGDPDNPPEVNPLATSVDELIALKKAETLTLVVPDANGTIEHLGQKWRAVTNDAAMAERARWVYVAAWLRYDEAPIVTYRQAGAFVGVIPKPEVPSGKLVLLPEEVASFGYLIVLSNRSPIQRAVDQKELIEFIIEF